jgi:hypothetical protein
VLLRCRASNSSCIAASHEGSRSAALAEVGSGEGAEVEAVQTNSSVGYRVDGRETPARARVTGPALARGGGGVGGVLVDRASPEAPLEGDGCYVANVSIIFDVPCLFYTNYYIFCLHFVALL